MNMQSIVTICLLNFGLTKFNPTNPLPLIEDGYISVIGIQRIFVLKIFLK